MASLSLGTRRLVRKFPPGLLKSVKQHLPPARNPDVKYLPQSVDVPGVGTMRLMFARRSFLFWHWWSFVHAKQTHDDLFSHTVFAPADRS